VGDERNHYVVHLSVLLANSRCQLVEVSIHFIIIGIIISITVVVIIIVIMLISRQYKR
jgi:hypothetical protein